MSCQCYQIGGPFIAEDPDCVVHGAPALARAREANRILNLSDETESVTELRQIIDQLHTLATELE